MICRTSPARSCRACKRSSRTDPTWLATFDFQSDNGSIKVISNSLSDSDKTWLEQTPNANQGLVNAVQAFHDDAVTSYKLWADADGQPLPSADSESVSQLADKSFSFMNMFQKAGQSMRQAMLPDGRYVASNGAPIDLGQGMNSPLSFLVFQKSNQAILNGTDTYTSSTGRTLYGAVKGNFFSMPDVIPEFVPAMSSQSVGLNATA